MINLVIIKEDKHKKEFERVMIEDIPKLIEKFGLPIIIDSNPYKGLEPYKIFDEGAFNPLLAEYISSCDYAIKVKDKR